MIRTYPNPVKRVNRTHGYRIASWHAGLIIQSAIDGGWEPPSTYSAKKRKQIAKSIRQIAQKLTK